MKDFKNEIKLIKLELGLIEKVWFTSKKTEEFNKLKEEKLNLPVGVFEGEYNGYFKYEISDLSADEIKELLTYRQAQEMSNQTQDIRIIKNCAIFFVVISVLSIIGGIIAAFNTFL